MLCVGHIGDDGAHEKELDVNPLISHARMVNPLVNDRDDDEEKLSTTQSKNVLAME